MSTYINEPIFCGTAKYNESKKSFELSFNSNVENVIPDFTDNFEFYLFKNKLDDNYSIYSSGSSNILRGGSFLLKLFPNDFINNVVKPKKFNSPSISFSVNTTKNEFNKVVDIDKNETIGYFKPMLKVKVGKVFDRNNGEKSVAVWPNSIIENADAFTNSGSRRFFLVSVNDTNSKDSTLYLVNDIRTLPEKTDFVFELNRNAMSSFLSHQDNEMIQQVHYGPYSQYSNISMFVFSKGEAKENLASYQIKNEQPNIKEFVSQSRNFNPSKSEYNIWDAKSFASYVNDIYLNYFPSFGVKEDIEKKYPLNSYISFSVRNNYFFSKVNIPESKAVGIVKGYQNGKLLIESPILDKPFTLSPYIADVSLSNSDEYNKFKSFYNDLIKKDISTFFEVKQEKPQDKSIDKQNNFNKPKNDNSLNV